MSNRGSSTVVHQRPIPLQWPPRFASKPVLIYYDFTVQEPGSVDPAIHRLVRLSECRGAKQDELLCAIQELVRYYGLVAHLVSAGVERIEFRVGLD